MENILNYYKGQTKFGNLESNINFLKKTGVIKSKIKILEIGIGQGGLLNILYKNSYDIQGIEINQDYIEKSKKLYGYLPVTKVDSEKLMFPDNFFDVVMSFDVFEHIPNSDKHLQEVKRVLKPEGVYLLQTPNKLTNVVFETIRWKSFTRWQADHCSLHNYWELQKRFEKNGFQIEFYEIPVVTEYFKTKIKHFLGGFGLFLLKILNPDKFPLWLKTNFYIKSRIIK